MVWWPCQGQVREVIGVKVLLFKLPRTTCSVVMHEGLLPKLDLGMSACVFEMSADADQMP